ncbi:serine protease persephone-like [Pieris brassicae]|uniref:trypsin n=1 Tax=Pieris brassicae TaxID=7116 RepID=A0A9P0XAI6_PIEBR|nr:serine protease persephone-like [Pieris brassicae]CAH4027315.1 unnamed protein product [Pieris brassicae]
MFKILAFFAVLNVAVSRFVGDECKTSGNEGTCVLVNDCPVAIRAIKENDRHPYKRCGFSAEIEIVCCPKTEILYKPTRTSTIRTEEKFGGNRVADIQCKKIVDSSIPPLGLHIIGGETASLGEFPHMVALGYEREDGYEFQCGGSLVSEYYVLTAAHCIDTLDQVKPSIARMGVVEIGGSTFNSESDVMIAELKLHPNYARKEKYHDLALIKLRSPAELSSNLNAICLYTQDDDPQVALTVTGWGKTSTTRDIKSNILLKANVSVVDISKCGESYTNWRRLPKGIAQTQICAGDELGRHDTCQGDSGGPLQALTESDGNYRLIGVTSFGRGCASTVPGVYTRVSEYLDWIESVVWPNES